MSTLLLSFLLILPAFSVIEKIQVKNLDLDYLTPNGSGTFEKLNIGMGLPPTLQGDTYPVSVYWREKSFLVMSPFADFEWLNPYNFIHAFKSLGTEKFNLDIGKKEHELTTVKLKFVSEKNDEFVFEDLSIKCAGENKEESLILKIKEDCTNQMQVVIKHMQIPGQFLKTIAEKLPEAPAETEFPANDFYLDLSQGHFYSYVKIKFVLPAYLKIWGFAQFEDSGKTIAIKVDEIRYGLIPVTSIVMTELKKLIKNPRVTIDPPWVRIKIGKYATLN